jgi:CO/xanthine dehydrogenase Mo-binding subunit
VAPVSVAVRAENVVGKEVPRLDAEAKVKGQARYADDLAFPGMLYGKAIRSDRPHARILRLDLSRVLAHPKVACVVTAKDIPGRNCIPIIYEDMPLLAEEVVRYVGEPIALLAAETREDAEEAAKLAQIEYEDLPAVFDPLEAIKPEAPQVAVPSAAEKGNIFNHMVIRKGDVGKGFAEADVVVEGEYRVGYQEHAYLEPQGMIAVPEENGMAVYGTLQCPFYVQKAVAAVLGLPLSRVRVVQTATGGGFGGKEDVPSQVAAMAAVLAWKSGRPVKVVFDRAEDIATTSKRHPGIIRYKTGAKRDGTLTAVEVEFYYNAGAYQTLSSSVLWRGLIHAAGPYRIPNVKIDAYSVATNTVPCGAFRGFGSPQVIFAHESQMDELARRLGMDPLELRRKNALREGDETATAQVLTESVGLLSCIDRAKELSRWEERKRAVEEFNRREKFRRRGLGVSTVMYGVGMGAKAPLLDKAGAYVKLEADGSITVAVGNTEMGQGAHDGARPDRRGGPGGSAFRDPNGAGGHLPGPRFRSHRGLPHHHRPRDGRFGRGKETQGQDQFGHPGNPGLPKIRGGGPHFPRSQGSQAPYHLGRGGPLDVDTQLGHGRDWLGRGRASRLGP